MATYQDVLRGLAVNDRTLISGWLSTTRGLPNPVQIGERTQAIARVAAIIAKDGSVQTFRWTIGDALGLGVTPDEIVGLMLAIAPLIGVAEIVNTAPKVALALDYDLDEALETL